jgi:uncharacterized protein (DUF2235 family)
MANIVICCDGTWNSPDQLEHGVPNPTNVVKIFNAVAEFDATETPQHKYYHPGVGTDGSRWQKILSGGTGEGLDLNIMSAYRELCDHYQPGSSIFLFGFSRGAYTVRSLAGLISACGLLKTERLEDADAWDRIERIFQKGYRPKKGNREPQENWIALGWEFHTKPGKPIPIHFLGVWDTVGALGIPDDMALLNLFDNLNDYTFHDTELSPAIKTSRHAVALDETRASFQPTLWKAAAGHDARQVWFAGVHADVGGGYLETGLSDIALKWMICEAEKCGLVLDGAMIEQIEQDSQGVLHDSCRGAFSVLPTQPRSAPRLDRSDDVHSSVLDRQKRPPIHQCPYRRKQELETHTPINVEVFARQHWNATGLWLEKDHTYTFEASGEWMDGNIKCGPAGSNDGHFQVEELRHLAGGVLGEMEDWFRKITKNEAAEFRFTRRHDDASWFCLMGAIANGSRMDGNHHRQSHECFIIGGGCVYTPLQSGYFYAYANDAWNCYANNRGRVQLYVK